MKKIKIAPIEQKIRFTQAGYDELKKTYENLLNERKPAVEDLTKARNMGDLKENGYYKASRIKLSFIDSQLRKFASSIKRAIIVNNDDHSCVNIGSTVSLRDVAGIESIYSIVGDLEAQPSKGNISLLSPLGKALAGKYKGDKIETTTPSGKSNYTIINIC